MSYVYLQSERYLYTVGFYDPDGEWQAESDHSTVDLAAKRVAYLNGGGDALELRGAIRQLKEQVKGLQRDMIDLKTTAAFAPFASQMERLRGKMDLLETVIAENATMRQAITEAREVVERLEGEDDPFMPPDGFWKWMSGAKCVATDKNGEEFWYGTEDVKAGEATWNTDGVRLTDVGFGSIKHRDLTGIDWRTTKRMRPSHL